MTRIGGLAFVLLLAVGAGPALAEGVMGRWVTEDKKALVEIGQCGAVICGKVRRVADAKAPKTDIKNPDPALRGRPIIGLDVLSGFHPSGNVWKGHIYDPKSGKSYKSVIRANPDGTLNVKGCILFVCQGQTWTRAR